MWNISAHSAFGSTRISICEVSRILGFVVVAAGGDEGELAVLGV